LAEGQEAILCISEPDSIEEEQQQQQTFNATKSKLISFRTKAKKQNDEEEFNLLNEKSPSDVEQVVYFAKHCKSKGKHIVK